MNALELVADALHLDAAPAEVELALRVALSEPNLAERQRAELGRLLALALVAGGKLAAAESAAVESAVHARNAGDTKLFGQCRNDWLAVHRMQSKEA